MKHAVLVSAIVLGFAAPAAAQASAPPPDISPLDMSRVYVNSRPWTNGQGLVTGATVNGAFQTIYPILMSMGTWNAATGAFTINPSAIGAGSITAAMLAPGASSGLSFVPVNRAGDTMSGTLGFPTIAALNLSYAGVPNPNALAIGNGFSISFCPALSCVDAPSDQPTTPTPSFFDHQRANLLLSGTTQDDGHSEEQNLAVTTTIATGYHKPYAASTNYTVGDNVVVGNAVYRAVTGGNTGANSAPPGTRPTAAQGGSYQVTDGTVTWQWINDAAIDSKVGSYLETKVAPGAGSAWGAAFNYHIQTTPLTGMFLPGVEMDYTNDSTTACALGVADCTALRLAMGGSQVTEGLQITGNATGTPSAIWALRINGGAVASQSDIEVDDNAPVGVGFGVSGLGGASHSDSVIKDQTTTPILLRALGSYTNGIDLGSANTTGAQIVGKGFNFSPTGALTAQGITTSGNPVLAHVANNNAISVLQPTTYTAFVRDGFATPGDLGRAAYTTTSTPCSLNSGKGDGGSQIGIAGQGSSWIGCALIDWASVPSQAANPCLFESCPTSTDDTLAIKAAIATARTVFLPALVTRSSTNYRYFVTSDIPQTVSGQLIFGEGRLRSMVQVNSNSGFTTGVFVSTAAEPGPIFRDFSIFFSQYDNNANDNPPQPIQYVPAIYAQNVPRWRSEHMAYFACWVCIDMRGNDGGTTFEDTQMSDFKYGRWIDGALDTIRINDDEAFPLGISSQYYNNYILSYGLPGSYNQIHNFVGRADDLKVHGGIYLAGQAFDVHKSTFNPNDGVGATLTVTNSRFDVSPGLTCEYGIVIMSGIQGGSGGPGLTGITNNGCNLTVGNSYMQMANPGTSTQSAPSGSAVYTVSGNTVLTGNIYDTGSADASVVVAAGGHTTETGERFNRNANISYPNTALITVTGGDVVLLGNSVNSIGSGSGRFVAVTQDNAANRVGWNSSPGYPSYTPSSPAGTYGSN